MSVWVGDRTVGPSLLCLLERAVREPPCAPQRARQTLLLIAAMSHVNQTTCFTERGVRIMTRMKE